LVSVSPRELVNLQIGQHPAFRNRDAWGEFADLLVEDQAHAACRLGVALEKRADAFLGLDRRYASGDPVDLDRELRRTQEPRGLGKSAGIGRNRNSRRCEDAARRRAEREHRGEPSLQARAGVSL